MNKAINVIETFTELASPLNTCTCKVKNIVPLSSNTFQVELQLQADAVVAYQAGQYLQLDLDVNGDGKLHSLSYSIANNFYLEQHRRLQLFIQNNNEWSEAILKHLYQLTERNTQVNVTLPMGRAYLQTDLDVPHLLIAAGSGISKIKCLTEEIIKQRADANVHIYWSNKNTDEFYFLDEFRGWENRNRNLSFTPILESYEDDWSGRSGYIYELIQEDFDDLNRTHVYLCGSPQMVYGTIDKLKATGLKEENCYSDVFEYAPRK